LTRIVPSNLTRFFYCNSGSEAVENAVKIARAATGRQDIIAFDVSVYSVLRYREYVQCSVAVQQNTVHHSTVHDGGFWELGQ
jgi:4-aminobutyrate aminotransferase-like enzyme